MSEAIFDRSHLDRRSDRTVAGRRRLRRALGRLAIARQKPRACLSAQAVHAGPGRRRCRNDCRVASGSVGRISGPLWQG